MNYGVFCRCVLIGLDSGRIICTVTAILFSFSGEKSALIPAETPPVLKQCVMQISLGKVLGAPGELDSLCSPLNHLWTRPIASFNAVL